LGYGPTVPGQRRGSRVRRSRSGAPASAHPRSCPSLGAAQRPTGAARDASPGGDPGAARGNGPARGGPSASGPRARAAASGTPRRLSLSSARRVPAERGGRRSSLLHPGGSPGGCASCPAKNDQPGTADGGTPMRVLVTGGAGFIGSHTVDSLLARGHQVRILDSLEPPVHTRERPAYLPPEVELLNGSVTERTALRRALEGIDAVIHLAAYQDYLTDFSRFFHVNTVSTALLYELVVNDQLPVQKIVLASTQAVYGEGKYHCPAHGVVYPGQRFSAQLERGDWDHHCEICGALLEPCWTDEPVVRPHNSYAMSKRAQEELALALAHRYSIPTVALRYSIVQGPRQSFRNPYSGALRSFTVRILAGRSPIVYEDGEQLRDYVSIHDVVRANL